MQPIGERASKIEISFPSFFTLSNEKHNNEILIDDGKPQVLDNKESSIHIKKINGTDNEEGDY
jgi:hypothetical protein